jgi:hypothetical protein
MIVLSAQRAPSRAHSQLSRWGRVQDFKEVCLPTARRLHTLGVRHVRWQLNPTLAVLFDDGKAHTQVQATPPSWKIMLGKMSKWGQLLPKRDLGCRVRFSR